MANNTNMDINVRSINKAKKEGSVKAYATVVVAEGYDAENKPVGFAMCLTGIKVVEKKDGSGVFVSFPQETYKDKDGKNQYPDIYCPINAETSEAIRDAVIEAYNNM